MTGKSLLFLILTLFLQHNILFSAETLDEQGFLFQALEQAYDVKIIKTSISSAVQKYLKTKEIYSPKATLGGNYLQQANDTNNPANKILEMKNLSLKTGLSKMFVTGTVLGIGAEASYSDSHFQTVTYITNATNVVSYPIANPTYQPNPLIAGY
ncbi:MAG TPA: hypothetical protein DC049_17625, partial [Spirochaetia bacterium]|nr:hypothetical protein [Spirochaetia bacterium]